VDGTRNSGGAITHEVEVNMFYKGHVERVRMDVCELGKTNVILGMPLLAVHNLEIDWEKGEVCHKSPAQTKDSMARGMGRMSIILRQTRQGILIIEKER